MSTGTTKPLHPKLQSGDVPRRHMKSTTCQRVGRQGKSGGTLITSSKVMRILQKAPHTTMVEGDSCAVGPEGKVNRNFRIRQMK
jgi:hypothetical protein